MNRKMFLITMGIIAIGITVSCTAGVKGSVDGGNGDDDEGDDFDDDADDEVADDDIDDDSLVDCAQILGGHIEECFEGLTTAEVCALEDSHCWVDCFGETDDCAGWLDCVESGCLNGDDDDTIDDNSISGTVIDLRFGTPVVDAAVEIVSDEDGSAFDPPIIAATDENGFVLFSDIPESANGTVAVVVRMDDYKDTYEFHFHTGTSNNSFTAVSDPVVTLFTGLLGTTPVITKGMIYGAVFWSSDVSGIHAPVGCAEVTFDPSVSEVHYFEDGGLGVMPTNDRDTDGNGIGDESGKGTNGELNEHGERMSYFVGVNADPGAHSVIANIDGSEVEAVIPYLCPDCVAITTLMFDFDPNEAFCTN